MTISLSYFLVIQSGGLPLYAQSFEFENDEACQSFQSRLNTNTSKKLDSVISGYFDAIKLIVSEIVEDRLNLMELGFRNYHITGLIKEELFFIGIFEESDPNKSAENVKQINEILVGLASRFLEKFPPEILNKRVVNFADYESFTDDIIAISNGKINLLNCRNCLEKCSSENKSCLPHKFYFEGIKTNEKEKTIELTINR